jgi:hypothetical protein
MGESPSPTIDRNGTVTRNGSAILSKVMPRVCVRQRKKTMVQTARENGKPAVNHDAG